MLVYLEYNFLYVYLVSNILPSPENATFLVLGDSICLAVNVLTGVVDGQGWAGL
jgi:hypothetical protein